MNKNRFSTNLLEILLSEVYEKCAEATQNTALILDKFKTLNDQLLEELKNPKNKGVEKSFEIAKNYQHWKFERFKDFFAEKDTPLIDLNLDDYKKEIQSFLSKQPKTKKKEQKKARFYSSKDDSRPIRIIKFFKKSLYHISIQPKKLLNLFRKIIKKAPHKIGFWKYKIPFRTLAAYHVENILTAKLNEAIQIFSAKCVDNLKQAIDLEQKINERLIAHTLFGDGSIPSLDKLEYDLGHLVKSQYTALGDLEASITELPEACHSKIQKLSDISGTIEYPKFFLNYQNRKKRKNVAFKRLRSANLGWGNTAFGLLEDWKIDQEIYNLNYFSKKKIDILIGEYQQSNIEVVDLLGKSKNKLTKFGGNLSKRLSARPEESAIIIQSELNLLKSAISIENFTQASELLITFNLPEKINQYESKIAGFLKEVSEKKWLTKLTEYNTPLSSSDLDSFSPRELISFEYLPNVVESCNSLKTKIVQHIESTQQAISNIEHVAAFNLSSVVESIEKGESEANAIPDLVEEGLDRTLNKLDEIIATIGSFEKETSDVLLNIAKHFIDSNTRLTVNENAFNLRIIVMKAKALKRSEEFGTKFLKRLRTYRDISWEKSKNARHKAEQLLIPWKKRIGLDSGNAAIATELSDFLQEVYVKINSLPIIYQRLYKIMPLTEMSLFTGRKKELETLHHAYKSWKSGKYSPTVIIGEKWSGHTSLINFFVEENLDENAVICLNKNTNIEKGSDFLSIWQEVMKTKDVETPDDVIAILLEKFKGKVIILENLQNYYLRTIHGFETLKMLIQIITKTSKDIYWICSANIYAWDYLNKTMELAGYFGYVIQMQPFSDDELRELILKKNNISGYKIIYSSSDQNKANKKFMNMNHDEQQLYLRNQFFNDLNNFAKGNISLALSFWLLSTSNITEESIEITNFQPPDFSFIHGLNTDKVFIIYLLIMHDGLAFDHLNKVYKKPEDKLRLLIIMMLDDGIIIEKNNRYEVNPLIYRHSINMLKAKNLIY